MHFQKVIINTCPPDSLFFNHLLASVFILIQFYNTNTLHLVFDKGTEQLSILLPEPK